MAPLLLHEATSLMPPLEQSSPISNGASQSGGHFSSHAHYFSGIIPFIEISITPIAPIVPRPSHSLLDVSISPVRVYNGPLTVLCQKQPVALLQSDPMSCKTSLSVIRPYLGRQVSHMDTLEYLSSGLKRAGCADFVTSPAWTCRKLKCQRI